MKPYIDRQWLYSFIKEDEPYGDPASDFIPEDNTSSAIIESQGEGYVCGVFLIPSFFKFFDPEASITLMVNDGDFITIGSVIAKIEGNTRSILRIERIVLNFISYLSGITTQTKKYTKITNKYGVKLLDTRKILPGYRALVKYSVQCGDGYNHRNSLSDLIMLKNNHIHALGGIVNTLEKVTRENKNPMIKIEIETTCLEEALVALEYKPDIIMLDNFLVPEAEEALVFLKDKAQIELSGGITLDTVEEYSLLKPDFISIGSDLTYDVTSVSFHLLINS
ncbi:MAG: carboxylating nicotinate-nucleotide diphosphorylase [Caldisericia bacterium]|nr:carboxylating nicotinate-nucleotide diphosphorylase [Caldisericia bacterium]